MRIQLLNGTARKIDKKKQALETELGAACFESLYCLEKKCERGIVVDDWHWSCMFSKKKK